MEETGENYRSNYDHIELGVLDSSPIVGFSDANHLDKIIDGGMYSTSGNCFLCYGNLVAWSSKKQTIHASRVFP